MALMSGVEMANRTELKIGTKVRYIGVGVEGKVLITFNKQDTVMVAWDNGVVGVVPLSKVEKLDEWSPDASTQSSGDRGSDI